MHALYGPCELDRHVQCRFVRIRLRPWLPRVWRRVRVERFDPDLRGKLHRVSGAGERDRNLRRNELRDPVRSRSASLRLVLRARH